MIKTRKIKLIPTGIDNQIKKRKIDNIKNIASSLSKMGNEIIRIHIQNQYNIDDLTKNKKFTKGDAKKYVEEILGTSIQNSGYQLTTKYSEIPSQIRSGLSSIIFKTISNNFYDIVNGKMSIPSYTKTSVPIPFSARNDKESGITNAIKLIDGKYILKFPCVDKSLPDMDFELYFGKDDSYNEAIVGKILSGEYKLCDSTLTNKADGDIILNLIFSFKSEQNVNINPNKIMGIDVGMNRPVSVYISDEKYQPKQIAIGEKIHHDRIKFSKHRQKLQKSLKYASGGHGTKNKLKELRNLKDKEKNWATNINHIVSREVINIAKQYNVGTIKMEDLTGIATGTDSYFLKTWKYYELQSFINYKAEEDGITILWVNPKNTSITCPICGNIDKENRNDKDKTKFKCTNPLCDDHNKNKDADIVGACNIALAPGEIIKPKSKKGIIEKAKMKKQLEVELTQPS